MNLTRDEIVTTALGIMDAYGLADLSMRRLATTLGVQPSALYWHFANKQTLLAAVADQVLADLPAFTPGDWSLRLRLWAARLHALLRRHRSGAELVSSVLALRGWDAGPGAGVERGLIDAGVDPGLARTASAGVLHLVLGHAFDEEQRAQAAELGVAPSGPSPDSATLLDDAVALLIAGLVAADAADETAKAV